MSWNWKKKTFLCLTETKLENENCSFNGNLFQELEPYVTFGKMLLVGIKKNRFHPLNKRSGIPQ